MAEKSHKRERSTTPELVHFLKWGEQKIDLMMQKLNSPKDRNFIHNIYNTEPE